MCTELKMLAHPDGPEIRPTDLKGVHIDSLVEQAVALCTAHEGLTAVSPRRRRHRQTAGTPNARGAVRPAVAVHEFRRNACSKWPTSIVGTPTGVDRCR
jgi:hypothetical protein